MFRYRVSGLPETLTVYAFAGLHPEFERVFLGRLPQAKDRKFTVLLVLSMLFVCLPVCLAICLSVCLFVCLSVCLSVSQSVCQSVCLSAACVSCGLQVPVNEPTNQQSSSLQQLQCPIRRARAHVRPNVLPP